MPASRRKFLKITSISLAQALVPASHRLALAWPVERTQSAISSAALARLRQQFQGDIVAPSDPGYDAARKVASFNPTTDRRPQLIARCANHDDVVRSVRFAREHELDASIRAGGFDVLGASTCDGGIVIDLSRMKEVKIDPQHQTAVVQAGVRAAELSAAAEPYGLGAALGCHPAIGITGLTLGGGLGWLAGKHGASCDNLIDATMVTYDRTAVHISAAENPDLFWALKGGGGNFGVVTSMTLRLHPVARVFGGVAAFRGDFAAFLRFYRDFMKQAPDELTVELSIRVLGKPTALATACWSGDPAEGERVLRPLREFGLLADAMGIVPYDQNILSHSNGVTSRNGMTHLAAGRQRSLMARPMRPSMLVGITRLHPAKAKNTERTATSLPITKPFILCFCLRPILSFSGERPVSQIFLEGLLDAGRRSR